MVRPAPTVRSGGCGVSRRRTGRLPRRLHLQGEARVRRWTGDGSPPRAYVDGVHPGPFARWPRAADAVLAAVLFVVIVSPIVWHLVRRLRRAEEQRIDLLQRAVDASSDERRRIAASLHDGPVQELAAVRLWVAALGPDLVHDQAAEVV